MLTTNDVGRILGEKAVKYTDLFNALNKACTEEERERILNLFEEYGIKKEIAVSSMRYLITESKKPHVYQRKYINYDGTYTIDAIKYLAITGNIRLQDGTANYDVCSKILRDDSYAAFIQSEINNDVLKYVIKIGGEDI